MERYTVILADVAQLPSLPLSYIAPSPDVAAYWALLDILGPAPERHLEPVERYPSWLVVLRTEASGAITEVVRLTGPEIRQFHGEARDLEMPES